MERSVNIEQLNSQTKNLDNEVISATKNSTQTGNNKATGPYFYPN
jgi:hypothetical protein